MTREVLEYLNVRTGFYVDATIGGAGHGAMILEKLREGMLLGIDLDQDALAASRERLGSDPRLKLVSGNFANLESILQGFPESSTGICGILFDLGASLHHFVAAERGFSYSADAPLDMRFDRLSAGPTALEVIRRSPEPELDRIFRELGEERFHRRIARQVSRLRTKIATTRDLADAVRSVVPGRFHDKALMRVFQALRITVNHELDNLESGLRQAIKLLAVGGRIVVLSYHSLEDRIVKLAFREAGREGVLDVLTRKPLRPALEEVRVNPSSRSARLRAAEKCEVGIANWELRNGVR
jgi:16S rRNA (cytosine1402-N4)-methyltransferase